MKAIPPQVLAVFLGVTVELLGCSSAVELPVYATSAQFIDKELNSDNLQSEMALSLVVNQMVLLRLLNDSSTTCSLPESERERLQDIEQQLNATEQVLEEVQAAKEVAMSELNEKHEQDQQEIRELKHAVKVEMHTWNEEVKQRLQELKAAAVNELENKTVAAQEVLEELNTAKEAAIRELNEKHEQDQEEIRELKTALKAEVHSWKEEASQRLQELRDAAVNELESKMAVSQETLKRNIQAALEQLIAEHRGKDFRLFELSGTHLEAMEFCESQGGRVATPENEEEDARIMSLVNNHTEARYYWIGVDDRAEEGTWVNSNTGLPLTYTNFADGEPNNSSVEEDCVALKTGMTGWHDAACDESDRRFVCEFNIVFAFT